MTDATATPAASAGPPPTADPQDPLPESNWFWRRIFVFVFGGLAIAGVAVVLFMIASIGGTVLTLIDKLGTVRDVRALDSALDVVSAAIKALASLGFWLIMVQLADRILYLIAPSAEQAAKMMATVSAWKGGISTSSTATVSGPGGTATTTTTAGAPAAPTPTLSSVVTTIQKDWTKYAG